MNTDWRQHMLGCIINVMSHWKTFKIPQHALMNSALLSSSNPLPPGQHMLIFFLFFFLLSRWVRSLAGSFRCATPSGLDTAASWSKCLMTVTWQWPRWRSIPSSWSRTWTRALARVSATRCPAGARSIAQRGTRSDANACTACCICTNT